MRELEFKILAYLKGELDSEEQGQVRDWVSLSDANQRTFDEIERIYQSSDLDADKFSPNVDQAWASVTAAMDKSEAGNRWMWTRIAAVITLIVGLGFLVFEYQNSSDLLMATTGDNEVKTIALADGTKVWLSENSKFEYPKVMDEEQRLVHLKGQAYFDVAKDSERPFKIIGASTVVEVLGTSFNLIAEKNYSNVNVTSGRVAFALADDDDIKVVLEKGSQATYEQNKMVVNATFNENAASWMTKDFVFKSSPLSQVAEVLSQHFDVNIKLDDTIKNCLITSSFEDKALDEILDTLEAIANIKNSKNGNTIQLTGPGC